MWSRVKKKKNELCEKDTIGESSPMSRENNIYAQIRFILSLYVRSVTCERSRDFSVTINRLLR